jgi:Asp-tRNA(Asn)/Glu-tRNA(Gln) amidotransferase A subunit family amidase
VSREPQDRRVDRRAFLQRMGALGAVAAAGPGWVMEGTADAAGAAPGASATPNPGVPAGASAAFWDRAAEEARARGIRALAPEELTGWEAGVRLREGSLTVPELVEACLARIDALDPVLLAFNTVTADAARARAGELAGGGGGALGLLHGLPVVLKDNLYTRGVRTTANAHMFRDFVPSFDATLVRRLAEAGCVVVGKSQMGPLATTRATTPDGAVTTVNAWAPDDPRVSPGGSSSGSATAVAARLAPLSVGTQTGGSITVPASSQGLTGLKPTMGRVSLRGVIPLTYSRDHPGPLVRDARDAALMLQVMAGPDPEDPRTLGLPDVPDYLAAATPVEAGGTYRMRWPTRLGVPPGWGGGSDPRDRSRADFLEALERGGVEIVELEPPAEWSDLSSGLFNAGRLPERSEPFLPWLREDVRLFGVTLSSWIQGLLLPGDGYLTVQRARYALLRLTLEGIFDGCDAVIQGNHVPFDMIGLPLISFPVGFREPGAGGGYAGGPLPESVMIGAPPFGEERLLALAALWQATTDHHRQRPRDPVASEAAGPPGARGWIDVEDLPALSE